MFNPGDMVERINVDHGHCKVGRIYEVLNGKLQSVFGQEIQIVGHGSVWYLAENFKLVNKEARLTGFTKFYKKTTERV